MVDAGRLLADEESTWALLAPVLAATPDERWFDPSLSSEGWSVHISVVHVAAWLDDCGRVLEAMAAGTFDPEAEPDETGESLERINAEHVVRAAALTRAGADHAIAAARARARDALAALPSIDADAWIWFEDSGPRHELKHLHDIRAWLAGGISDPAVGDLLDAESEAWIEFAGLLDSVEDLDARDPDGLRAIDVCHHLLRWMQRAAPGIAADGGLPPSDDSIDEVNAGFLAESAPLDALGTVRAALDAARLSIRGAFATLAAPSPAAKEAFAGDTTEHYEEHLAGIRGIAAR